MKQYILYLHDHNTNNSINLLVELCNKRQLSFTVLQHNEIHWSSILEPEVALSVPSNF